MKPNTFLIAVATTLLWAASGICAPDSPFLLVAQGRRSEEGGKVHRRTRTPETQMEVGSDMVPATGPEIDPEIFSASGPNAIPSNGPKRGATPRRVGRGTGGLGTRTNSEGNSLEKSQ